MVLDLIYALGFVEQIPCFWAYFIKGFVIFFKTYFALFYSTNHEYNKKRNGLESQPYFGFLPLYRAKLLTWLMTFESQTCYYLANLAFLALVCQNMSFCRYFKSEGEGSSRTAFLKV